MKRCHFMALDTHGQFCEMAAVNDKGAVTHRGRCATNILALVEQQPVYAEQNKGNTNPWSTPYDTTPVFNEVIAKMIDGTYDAKSGHAAAVKGCQDIIIKYLSS